MDKTAVTRAVEVGILTWAQNSAHDRVTGATQALTRLGALSSGRWRAAARDLEGVLDALDKALDQSEADLDRHARHIGVPALALLTVGEAAGTYDTLRANALSLVESSDAERLLQSESLYGMSILEDQDSTDRGSTLIFSWADPLNPVVWRWEASWLEAGDEDEEEDDEGEADVLDDEADVAAEDEADLDLELDDEEDDYDYSNLELFPVAALEVPESVLQGIAADLDLDQTQVVAELEQVAEALTRSFIIEFATPPDAEDDADAEDELDLSNGHA